MGEIFTPSRKAVMDLFSGQSCYQIPAYQRPYSWGTEQVEELWADISQAIENNDEEYFLGSIILTKNNSNYMEIVDGQQRLTTLTILFCVLRDLYYKNAADQAKRFKILGRIKNIETDTERLRFKTQIHHQNTFEQEILNGINFDKERSRKEIEKDNFLNAAFIFKEKIEQLLSSDPKSVENFTDYLLTKVKVITVECTTQPYAIKLFKVLNNRGLELSESDLIKSYLMSELKEEDWQTFEQDWIQIENKSKELNQEMDSLFTYYEYYLLAQNPKRSLYVELEKLFKNKDAKEVIHNFKEMVKFYDEIDDQKDKAIYSLKYLTHDVFWKSILITAKMENWPDAQLIELAKSLRKFYYLYWIAEYTTTKIKQTSFNIIGWIKNKKDVNYIKDEIKQKLIEDRVIQKAIRNLNGQIYGSRWCAPLLSLIEYQQTDNSNLNFIKLDNSINVEHILPQGYQKIKYWTNLFTREEAENLLNTIGNITLLSGKKNIGASNKPFKEKLEIYKGKGIDGVTGFRMTQFVIDAITSGDDWSKQKIDERKKWMLAEAGRIFEVNLFEEFAEEEKETPLDEPNVQTKELFEELQKEILKLGNDIKVESKKHYIAFKRKSNFASVKVQQSKIKIWVKIDTASEKDIKSDMRDVSAIGHHGTGDTELILDSKDKIQNTLTLIKKSYENDLNRTSVEYTEDYHLDKIKDIDAKNKITKLIGLISSSFPEAEIHYTKGEIIFSNVHNFATLYVTQKHAWLNLSLLNEIIQNDVLEIYKGNDKKTKWKAIKITNTANLDLVLPFVKKAYEKDSN